MKSQLQFIKINEAQICNTYNTAKRDSNHRHGCKHRFLGHLPSGLPRQDTGPNALLHYQFAQRKKNEKNHHHSLSIFATIIIIIIITI
ncbi:hypothetical protein H5410_034896 [Solanum commersonii]|uniref:Uncharacterized protein n=1 Tax=Solanum commersonii TaxID=4109 RepID=A0A9J5Y295_SOLCO|nr:hypothetical protein H5410_034896 [Solanum commersonii]